MSIGIGLLLFSGGAAKQNVVTSWRRMDDSYVRACQMKTDVR